MPTRPSYLRNENKACVEKDSRQIVITLQVNRKEGKSCMGDAENCLDSVSKKKRKIIDEKYDKCVEDHKRILKENL